MRVTIEIPEQQDLKIICRGSDSILQIKEKIFQLRGFFIGFYKLLYKGQELADIHRILDYGIEDGSIIQLIHWNTTAFSPDRQFFSFS